MLLLSFLPFLPFFSVEHKMIMKPNEDNKKGRTCENECSYQLLLKNVQIIVQTSKLLLYIS